MAEANLKRTATPLGDLEKPAVRELAQAAGLRTFAKKDSQEICFVPDGDYAKVVERLRPEAGRLRGDIVDEAGRVLGEHRGVHHFTVGQRHGLGISSDRRLYVLRLDPREQKVVVGGVEGLDCGRAQVDRVNWVAGTPPSEPVRVRVQVRHRHSAVLARVTPRPGERAEIAFEEPVRAVAPGQAAVFYDAEEDAEVIGGGWLTWGNA